MEKPQTTTSPLNPDELQRLLQSAGDALKMPPNQLEQSLSGGKPEQILGKLSPKQAKQLQQIMANPALAQKLLQSPAAQKLMQKFRGRS